jgi:hypothetical protein
MSACAGARLDAEGMTTTQGGSHAATVHSVKFVEAWLTESSYSPYSGWTSKQGSVSNAPYKS